MARKLVRSEALSVATSVTTIMTANPKRVAYIIANSDANDVHCTGDVGAAPTTTFGDLLEKTGGRLADDILLSGDAVKEGLRGIATTGAVSVYVREWEE